MSTLCLLVVLSQMAGSATMPADASLDRQFEQLGARYLDEFPALSPVSATALGDHRFDSQLDTISAEARAQKRAFYHKYLEQLSKIEPARLSRANQVDYALLKNDLKGSLWRLETLQEWAWNPIVYTQLSGSAIYNLMARDFAPLKIRLAHVEKRLEQFPRLFRQIRATLDPKRVPLIHVETAIKQNRGVLSILENLVKPNLDELQRDQRDRLERSMVIAKTAVEEHQEWLEAKLLPNARGDFRLGTQLYDKKLAFVLKTTLTRVEIRQRAEKELVLVRNQMFRISQQIYKEKYPYTEYPEDPSPAYKQALIRSCLELAYREIPRPDEIVETAKRSLELATVFIREKDLLTLPQDPVEIIVMPEFKRGVALAYCDSPGPLDVGLKTFYAVAPLPEDWTTEQVQSFLCEYNILSIHDLTMHEAMPGHFVQLALSNRYPGKLRAVLSSGVFIEGWAIYSERMMIDAGFLDGDPLMRLINLKWYLRGIGNAIIDQAIHTEGMTREHAMKLMMEDTFQEEREAAGKWVRAQLTSAQLSTYFVGTVEHFDLRRDIENIWDAKFDLKTYHDRILSYGSPPVQYVRALVLNEEIPHKEN